MDLRIVSLNLVCWLCITSYIGTLTFWCLGSLCSGMGGGWAAWGATRVSQLARAMASPPMSFARPSWPAELMICCRIFCSASSLRLAFIALLSASLVTGCFVSRSQPCREHNLEDHFDMAELGYKMFILCYSSAS